MGVLDGSGSSKRGDAGSHQEQRRPLHGRQSGCRLWLGLAAGSAHCSLLKVRLINVFPQPPGTWACFGSWNRFPCRRDAAVQTQDTCSKPRSVLMMARVWRWAISRLRSVRRGPSVVFAALTGGVQIFRRTSNYQLGKGKNSGALTAISTPIAWSHGHAEGQTNGRGEPLVPLLLTAR